MKLQKGTLSDFHKIYQDMQLQFPPEELKPEKLLSDLIQSEKYHLWLATENSSSVAYVLICPYQDYLWLDYIAVFPSYQSKGYGSKIIPLLADVYPASKGIFLEVEHETQTDINTLRRARFYRKLGADVLLPGYLLPTKQGGFPMALYFLPHQGETPQKDELLQMIWYAFDTIHADIPARIPIFEKIKKEL